MIFDVVVVYGHRAVGQVTVQCSPTFEAVVQCLSDHQITIVIEVADDQELKLALQSLRGQLTATLIGEPGDLQRYQWLVPVLEQKVGRILVNGYPTGVEVCDAMMGHTRPPRTRAARPWGPWRSIVFYARSASRTIPMRFFPLPCKTATPCSSSA